MTAGDVLASADTAVGSLGLRPPLTVPGDADLGQVARAMRSHGSSCVLVGEHSILTERDLTWAMAEEHGPATPAQEFATKDAKTVPADMPLAKAAALMVRYGIRHLPVMAPDGSVMGFLEMEAPFRVLLRNMGALAWLAELDGVVSDGVVADGG
jgi:CBS domain-containing protein